MMTAATITPYNDQVLAEALPYGIVIVNERSCLSWWNLEAEHLLGLEYCEQECVPITDIIGDAIYQALKECPLEETLRIDAPNLSDIRLSLKLRPSVKNQKLIMVQDITQTERLEVMRKSFIANVSHELRTPLAVFRGYLELLQDSDDLPAEQYKDILSQMTEQSDRMERLVQELLLLSRLESIKPDIDSHQQVPVAYLLRDISNDAKIFGGKKHHEFHLHLDEALDLWGDAEELRSAFSNIIYNAVRYTPAEKRIDIYWYQDEMGKHMKVCDMGIGIPEESLSKITQRFYRVDKARAYEDQSGSGLGLAIVKHVLLRHNGQLNVASKLGKGSTFSCFFPR